MTGASPARGGGRWPGWRPLLAAAVAAAVLAGAVVAIFHSTAGYPFSYYDDDRQILENPHVRSLGLENLYWIYTHFCITNYYPTRLLSYAVDYRLWAGSPGGFHLGNLLIHAGNVLLLFWLLVRLGRGASLEPAAEAAGGSAGKYPAASAAGSGAAGSGVRGAEAAGGSAGKYPAASAAGSGAAGSGIRGAEAAGPSTAMPWHILTAALAAALLAVHPVVVEPVAWIPGREELLMTCFAILALHARVSARRAAAEGASRGRVAGWHLLTALACAGAATSNIVGAAVPLLVLAYDLTAAGIRRIGPLVAGNGFLWPITAGAIVVRQIGEPITGIGGSRAIPLAQHAALVLDGYRLNLGTLLAPRDLTLLYPRELPTSLLSFGPLAGAALGVLTLAALWFLRRRAVAVFSLLWFLLALGPTSQVIPHEIHRADRYLYLPLVGLALLIGTGLLALVRRGTGRKVLAGLFLVVPVVLGVCSTRQVPVWQDGLTLFEHCVALAPKNASARLNLGLALLDRDRLTSGAQELREALRLDPSNAATHYNLGVVAYRQGNLTEAQDHFETAMRLEPTRGRFHHSYGVVLSRLGDNTRAIRHLQEAIRLAPDMAASHAALGLVLLREQRIGEAIQSLQEALRLNPDHSEAHANLATALALEGRFGLALQHCDEALRRDPALADQMSRLARLLAASPEERLRNGPAAVQFAERACRAASQQDPTMLDTLAAAYAEAGRFDEAVATAQRAIDLAQALGRTDLAGDIRWRLAFYKSRQPLRQAQDAGAVLPAPGPSR